MRRFLWLLICTPVFGQIGVFSPGVFAPQATATATPGFFSEAGQNSTLTIALSTSGGTGIIPTSTCASYGYCQNFAETCTAGNLCVVPYQYANGGTVVSATTSDDESQTYTCSNPPATDSNKLLGLCFFPNSGGTAHKVSTVFGTTAVTQVNGNAATFYNIATSSPLHGSVQAVSGSSSTTMTGPTLTTSNNDLVYAYFCRTGTPLMTSGSFTAGSGFTLSLPKYQDGCASEWEVSTGGSVTPTMTMGSASTYLVIAAAFKAAPLAGAGTAPSGAYLKRFWSWSSNGTVSASTTKFQLPNESGDELAMTEAGAATYAMNSITDSGTDVWALAGQCNSFTGSCSNSGGYSSEFYVNVAAANTTNTQTMNFTGTGDATINAYDFGGAGEFVGRGVFSSNATTTNLIPTTAFSYLPYATSILTIGTGPIAFDTAITVASPSGATNYFDGGFFGGETINGGGVPVSIIGQNNIWSHSYQTGITSAQNWQWNLATNTSQANNVGVDLITFVSGSGMGIVNQAEAQSTSSVTDLQVTVPTTKSGNLLAISTGFYDGGTVRTVSKVCTGTSTTCATGTLFTQASSSTTATTAALLGTDIWYLLNAPAGVTTITVVYSGTVTNSEIQEYEAQKGGGGTWATDGANKISAGGSCTTCSGGSITPTGTVDFCLAHLATSGTGVTANPASGNAWAYTGTAPKFTDSGSGATALLTTSSSAQTPQWTTATGTINSSDACFK